MITAILNVIAALMGWFKPKSDPIRTEIKTANDMAQTSATISRTTTDTTRKELSNVQTETDASVARVHDADSLLDAQRAVSDAIRAANSQPGADD